MIRKVWEQRLIGPIEKVASFKLCLEAKALTLGVVGFKTRLRKDVDHLLAFIEYRDVRSADTAYKRGNGRRIDGVNVLVDRELARVDKYWLPRRLGGGKGGDSRKNADEEQYIKSIRKELREQWKAAETAKNEPKETPDESVSKRQKTEEQPAGEKPSEQPK